MTDATHTLQYVLTGLAELREQRTTLIIRATPGIRCGDTNGFWTGSNGGES